MKIKFGEYIYDSPKYFFQHMTLKLKYRLKLILFWLNFKRRRDVFKSYMEYRLQRLDIADIISRHNSYRKLKRLHKAILGEEIAISTLKWNYDVEQQHKNNQDQKETEIKIEFYQGIRLRD